MLEGIQKSVWNSAHPLLLHREGLQTARALLEQQDPLSSHAWRRGEHYQAAWSETRLVGVRSQDGRVDRRLPHQWEYLHLNQPQERERHQALPRGLLHSLGQHLPKVRQPSLPHLRSPKLAKDCDKKHDQKRWAKIPDHFLTRPFSSFSTLKR